VKVAINEGLIIIISNENIEWNYYYYYWYWPMMILVLLLMNESSNDMCIINYYESNTILNVWIMILSIIDIIIVCVWWLWYW